MEFKSRLAGMVAPCCFFSTLPYALKIPVKLITLSRISTISFSGSFFCRGCKIIPVMAPAHSKLLLLTSKLPSCFLYCRTSSCTRQMVRYRYQFSVHRTLPASLCHFYCCDFKLKSVLAPAA